MEKLTTRLLSFKCDIHDPVIALDTGSLTLSNMRFLCITYIFMYILHIYIYEIYDIYFYMIWDC